MKQFASVCVWGGGGGLENRNLHCIYVVMSGGPPPPGSYITVKHNIHIIAPNN